MPIGSSKLPGRPTCPETEKITVPPEFDRSQSCEPRGALAHDRRHGREALRVVDRRRLAVEAEIRGERRLEARPTRLAFERLQQRGFLAADIGAGADEHVQVEVDARPQDVLAQEPGRIGLRERGLEPRYRLAEEFTAYVVVADRRGHRVAADRHALDDRVRVVAQDVPVMAGAGLGLVGIADDVFLRRRAARHEAPFHAGRKGRAAASAQARGLDLVDDLLARSLLAAGSFPRPDSRPRAGSPPASRNAPGRAPRKSLDSVRKPSDSPGPHFKSSKTASILSGVKSS